MEQYKLWEVPKSIVDRMEYMDPLTCDCDKCRPCDMVRWARVAMEAELLKDDPRYKVVMAPHPFYPKTPTTPRTPVAEPTAEYAARRKWEAANEESVVDRLEAMASEAVLEVADAFARRYARLMGYESALRYVLSLPAEHVEKLREYTDYIRMSHIYVEGAEQNRKALDREEAAARLGRLSLELERERTRQMCEDLGLNISAERCREEIDAGTSGSINDSKYRWLRDLPPEELADEESATEVDPRNLPEDIVNTWLRDKPKKAEAAPPLFEEKRGRRKTEEELRAPPRRSWS
jgi:hypothetical protein